MLKDARTDFAARGTKHGSSILDQFRLIKEVDGRESKSVLDHSDTWNVLKDICEHKPRSLVDNYCVCMLVHRNFRGSNPEIPCSMKMLLSFLDGLMIHCGHVKNCIRPRYREFTTTTSDSTTLQSINSMPYFWQLFPPIAACFQMTYVECKRCKIVLHCTIEFLSSSITAFLLQTFRQSSHF